MLESTAAVDCRPAHLQKRIPLAGNRRASRQLDCFEGQAVDPEPPDSRLPFRAADALARSACLPAASSSANNTNVHWQPETAALSTGWQADSVMTQSRRSRPGQGWALAGVPATELI